MSLSHLAGQWSFVAIATVWASLPAAGAALHAEERPSPASRDAESARRLEHMVQTAAEYDVTAGDGSDGAVELLKQPLLRWSNPLRECDDGALFLWTQGGRPVIAACVYNVGQGIIEHELQSLASGPLRATRHNSQVWSPAAAGVELKPVPGAPGVPASTPARRLTQMRNILRGFSAAMGHDRWRHELRLMPQPLHRYSNDGAVVDGALFAFAQGTDPEVLFLLEARKSDHESADWHYAVARMNMAELDLMHSGKVVWNVNTWDRRLDPRQPYITFAFNRGLSED
jgi:hypothetical protein